MEMAQILLKSIINSLKKMNTERTREQTFHGFVCKLFIGSFIGHHGNELGDVGGNVFAQFCPRVFIHSHSNSGVAPTDRSPMEQCTSSRI